MAGMQAVPPEFDVASKAINATLDDLGGKAGSLGRGFSEFGLTPKEASKAEAQKASEDFAEKWEWGVRALCQWANNFAVALGLSAGLYQRMDQQAQTMFKTIYTNVLGNPHLSGEEISQRDWGATLADNPANNLLHPDYSMESFDAMVANGETNYAVTKDSAPQAISNVMAVSNLLNATPGLGAQPTFGLPDPSFDSGQMEKSSQLRQGGR